MDKFLKLFGLVEINPHTSPNVWSLRGKEWWCICCDAKLVSFDDPESGKWFNMFGMVRKIRCVDGDCLRKARSTYEGQEQVVVAVCCDCLKECEE